MSFKQNIPGAWIKGCTERFRMQHLDMAMGAHDLAVHVMPDKGQRDEVPHISVVSMLFWGGPTLHPRRQSVPQVSFSGGFLCH
jgi:hypothetical protein